MGQIQQLFDENKFDRSISKKSASWYSKQTKSLSGINSDMVLREGGVQSKSIKPGSMYMFYYSPKFRETLPHYDTFPMVIPYKATSNGFIGLNLHYLPVQYRVKLLDALMKFATSETLTPKTKLQYSWSMVNSFAQTKLAEACVHRYISGYVKSNFVMIEPKNWFSACMLPVQRFKKESATSVWSKSLS